MDSFHKQIWEEFEITVDFSAVMATGETIMGASSSVISYDKNGDDESATTLGVPTYHSQDVAVLVKAGIEAKSPYKITFKVETNSGNKWEKDLRCTIAEI